MGFERNDIVVKTKLADALGDELMGFEHNDIVTTDVMNKAIAEGGGGVMNEIFPLSMNMTLKMSGQGGGGTTYQLTDLTQSGTWFAWYIQDPDFQYYQIYGGIVEFTDGDYDLVVFSNVSGDEGGGYFDYDSTAWAVTVSGDAEIVDSEDDPTTKSVHVFGDCVVNAAYNE